jgi:gas vesicle structural protein
VARLQFRNSLKMGSPFEQVAIFSNEEPFEDAELSLLETLDHVLNRGLVIAGEITISVADIDLVFVGLNILVSSVETAHEVLRERERRGVASLNPSERLSDKQ